MKARLKNITALPLLERAIKLMWVKDSLSPWWRSRPTPCQGDCRCALKPGPDVKTRYWSEHFSENLDF
jgi:hypothetical protein